MSDLYKAKVVKLYKKKDNVIDNFVDIRQNLSEKRFKSATFKMAMIAGVEGQVELDTFWVI